ncbi:MAG: hypothetical protein ACLFV7_14805 [Phycisphaerae bacterium]
MSHSRKSRGRVEQHSPRSANERAELDLKLHVRDLAERLDAIDERLQTLDGEWDIERTLEANAATITLASLLLGKRWKFFRLLPFAVAGFLLQHAIQGWCPPVSIFRRMGVRTTKEIDQERYALRALRGDFDEVARKRNPRSRAEAAIHATTHNGR